MEGRIHQQKAVEQLQIFGAAAGFDDAHETEDLHPKPTPRLPLPHIQLQFWVHQLGGSCTSADIKKLWSLSELLYHKCVFWKPKKNCWNEHPSKDVIVWREKWRQKSKRSCIFEILKIPQSLLIWNLKNQHLPKLHCDKMHFFFFCTSNIVTNPRIFRLKDLLSIKSREWNVLHFEPRSISHRIELTVERNAQE